jgi:hypothetical protein
MLSGRTRAFPLLALATVAAALAVAVAVPAFAQRRHARPKPPTRAQIHRALRRAEHSRALWATVNICNTTSHPNLIGIRGQMPALGFPSVLTMQVQLKYWSYADNRFEAVPHTKQTISLGRQRRGVFQSGISYQLSTSSGMFAATVRFAWRLGRRTLGHVTRWTSPHHPAAEDGDPRHFSEWKCVIAAPPA